MDYIKQAKEQIMSMSPEKQEELMKELNSKLSNLRFIPNAGPQTEAYFSPADELLYGGSAGCVSGDTEFMTPDGWKRIDEYKQGDLVGMIFPNSMDLAFAVPEAYIDLPCEKMRHFTSDYLSMALSGEHRCLLEIDSKLEVRMADAITPELSANIPVNFELADFERQNGMEFAFKLSLKGKDRITVGTKREADYIQYMAHLNKRIATIHKTPNDKYLVRIYKNKKAKIGTPKNRITTVQSTRKYCFTLPTGFWLARHDDKIFITGNSGKSGLILGLAFTQHKRSLIMRRKYTDLDGLTEDALRLFGEKCKLTGGSRPKIKTDDNRLLEFGAARHEGDEQGFQGVPHDLLCVGKGTMVLMADRSKKPIEDIKLGDDVMTLDGSRRVTRIIPKRKDEAVRMDILDETGSLIGSQVQSFSHKVLNNFGWASYDKFCELHPCEFSSPIRNHDAHKFFLLYVLPFLESYSHLLMRQNCLQLETLSWKDRQNILSSLETSLHKVLEGLETYSLLSDRHSREVEQQALFRQSLQELSELAHELKGKETSDYVSLRDAFYAQFYSLLKDFQDYYQFGSHLYDEHTQIFSHSYPELKGVLTFPQLLSDVERPNPNCCLSGELDNTPKHNLRKLEYPHPYRKETCYTHLTPCIRTFNFTPVGVVDLYDIEVEDLNHYITNMGIVNKNCFDELSQFTEYQYKYLQTWLRTVEKGQRTRIIGATNPPTSVEGEWVIKRWAAWLDPTHPNPAKAGELRWYVTDPEGKDIEVPDDKPVYFPGRPNPSLPKSRTFIPGKVADNPYLGSDYVATLDTLPEPLRSAMRDGNFMMSRKDVDWQTIPTAWVDDAMARWHKMKVEARGTPMCAIGVDVCQAGGNDNAVLARRYDGWYDELITVPGSKLKTEDDITSLILKHRRDGAEITVDSSGGYGTHTVEQLKSNDIEVNRYIGKKNTDRRSIHGRFGFPNTRSAAYWLFREALDPSQPGGSQIALPADMELRSELTAPTYELTTKGFKIENKEDVKDKLGRSPDKADAVVMAWFYGRKGIMSSHPSQIYAKMNNSSTKKNVVVKLSNSQRTRRGR